MKTIRSYLPIYFIFLLTTSVNPVMYGQSVNNVPVNIQEFSEKLIITTDREIYITGEQALLKIYKINRNSGYPSGLSRIIYAELLDTLNNPLVQVKIQADGTSGSGWFIIPDTIASGNYFLRAYTKWMLNFPETLYSYKTISIINPYRNFTGLVKNEEKKPEVTKFTSSRQVTDEAVLENNNQGESIVRINVNSDKAEYSCRSKVILEISVSGSEGNFNDIDMSVSIVKSPLAGSGYISLKDDLVTPAMMSSFRKDSLQLPELEGEIISGTIKDKLTNEPIANADFSLSVVGKYSGCRFGKTNSNGEFIFPFAGLFGTNDIVIQVLQRYEAGCYVELNQPFSGTFMDFSPETLYLDSIKASGINNAIISMQVNNQYASSREKKEKSQPYGIMSDFYDSPYKRVYLSDYIELTNIREVVKEILPEVTVTGRDNNARLKVAYGNPYGKFENPALVLVDGVPVQNIRELLNVPCREMERIDIINVRYFYSDFVFDGIISFVTKKGNLSDLGYDNTVFRQVFEGCQEPVDFYSPSYCTDSLKDSHIPDFRNTLFWDPEIITDEGRKKSIEFYTSDEPGEYTITVEGLTSRGKPVSGKSLFKVK